MGKLALVAVAVVAALVSTAADACKKGCRCGNTCISCSKTCRLDSPTQPPDPWVQLPVYSDPTPAPKRGNLPMPPTNSVSPSSATKKKKKPTKPIEPRITFHAGRFGLVIQLADYMRVPDCEKATVSDARGPVVDAGRLTVDDDGRYLVEWKLKDFAPKSVSACGGTILLTAEEATSWILTKPPPTSPVLAAPTTESVQ